MKPYISYIFIPTQRSTMLMDLKSFLLFHVSGVLIAQLGENEVGNLRVASSSSTLSTGRNEPPIHPAVVLWQQCNASQGVKMVQECTGTVRG